MNTKTAALLVSVLLVIGGCASSGVNKGDLNLMSLEEEWQLGNQLTGDIARQMPIVNDAAANEYVNRVGRAIAAQTEMGRLPWNFHIVQDPAINAFNIPGGHVYVTTGLIAAADQANELAGVIAHEISHGVSRHGTEQMSRAYGMNIIASVALGQNPSVYQQILAQVVGGGALARYSRSAETEADDLGVAYMQRAGWDPRGMVTMFQTLLQQRQGRPGSVEKFFSSHPLTEDRIRDASKEIAKLPASGNLRVDDPAYQSIRSRIGAAR